LAQADAPGKQIVDPTGAGATRLIGNRPTV
jgi:hypothetical protein